MAAAAGDGRLLFLAGQLVAERDVLGGAAPRAGQRPLEEALTALRKGALLLKHGRHGRPKVHFFRVTACDMLLKWRSASGSLKQVKLRSVTHLVTGQTTEVFRRHPLRDPQARSLSLLYTDDEGSKRSLDLTCADAQQFELWHAGLCALVHRLRALGVPVTPAGAGVGTPAAPQAALGAAGIGGTSPADVALALEQLRVQQALSPGAALAMPAPERVPCDLLAWGSAQRVPPIPSSLRSGAGAQENCWQHRSLPGLAPGNAQLDAHAAAVGRKHAAVVTATGAVYTWGEGRSGKLGLGHDQDQPQPQRVEGVLEGQCAVAVACGDDCTAALTASGELYMWGRLHAGSQPQLLPLHVRGDLHGQRVTQISCGPFHCAAVSASGQLFTWGEGFGGKLGHGDQGNRSRPAMVQAFAGRQVLEAACGVWHTAAIVVESEGSLAALHQLQHSPMGAAMPPASPVHHGISHNRNASTSSAFSEGSVLHEGQGGSLYTWGGVNESVAFGSSEKHDSNKVRWAVLSDSNKGCLGHGETDLYRGQLLPARVGGALEHQQVRHVAAGSHLTVAAATDGKVFQMGVTGASGLSKHCPWEGATLPERVRGQLQGYFVDNVACGMHHVVAVARPLDRRLGRPAEHAARTVFAWGRGSEGQLGVKSFDDSAAPVVVDALKGRAVLQVACGGSNTMAVSEHSVHRWEPDSREEADAAGRVLAALTADSRPPATSKQLRIPVAPSGTVASSRPESEHGGSISLVRRSFSLMARSSYKEPGGMAAVPQEADLPWSSGRSVHSIGGGSIAGSGDGPAHSYSQSHAHAPRVPGQRQQLQFQLSGGQPHPAGSPAKSAGGAGGFARQYSYSASGAQGFGRRSSCAGGSVQAGMTSAHSLTLSGGRHSDLGSHSSRCQWRSYPDGPALEREADSGGDLRALGSAGDAYHALSSSADLTAALDEAQSGSSTTALQAELAEKNRVIAQLQRRLEKMQQHSQQPPRRADSTRSADERLRESVLLSTSAFREMQRRGAAGPDARAAVRPQTSPPASGSGHRFSPTATSPAAAQEEQALHAMQLMLQKKEQHLEGERAKLAAWAAELQRREAVLQRGQVAAHGPAAAAPPADAGRAGAAVQQPAAAGGSSTRPQDGAAGAAPETPLAPGEWTEEFEPGVFLTFAGDAAAKKLKRIRFSRQLFTADTAKQWYEEHKHCLAQPSTPPAAALGLRQGLEELTPDPAGQQQQQQQGEPHYRQGSRNLSFDARELAAFSRRLVH